MEKDQLLILIDSQSLDQVCSESPERARRLLDYRSVKLFEFTRTPLDTICDSLGKINQFEQVYKDGKLYEFKLVQKEESGSTESRTWFPYDEPSVYLLGTRIFAKENLSDAEKEAIMLVHINMAWDWENEGMFVTENKLILAARARISASASMKRTILNIDEAMDFMDLFAKRQSEFYLAPNHTANKGLWYWISLRSKLPHYNVSMDEASMLNALVSRFRYLLMSIDEIGRQYHLGMNNDAQEDMIYHFNYFIALITGIFDNLALESRNRYKIAFDHDFVASRTSLSNNVGADFLRELKNHNPDLREHIQKHVDFINLVYEIRELVVHREGLRKMGLQYDNITEKWQANVIQISSAAMETIKRIGDFQMSYSPFSKWGVYRIHSDIYLEPYRFAKTATITLIKFVDRFMELMGEKNWVATEHNALTEDIDVFEKWSLGFYADGKDR